MPPRKLPSKAAQKHELEAFAERYDTLADIYGDPVEVVFKIMADTDDRELKLQAANTLMGYRYPRVKAAEGTTQTAPSLVFNVQMPAAPLPERDVSPLPGRSPLVVVKDP